MNTNGYAIVNGVAIPVENCEIDNGSIVAVTAKGTIRVRILFTLNMVEEEVGGSDERQTPTEDEEK